MNADWLVARQDWITVIADHYGDDIFTAAPLDIAHSAYIEALDPKAITTFVNKPSAIGDGGCITAGCNFMAFDHGSNQSPHVPICKRRVQDLKDTTLRNPGPSPFVFDIVINWRANVVSYGKLIHVSPIETQDAMIWRVADRIKSGAPDEEVASWKKCS